MKRKINEAKRLCAVILSIVMALPASTAVYAAQTDVLNLDPGPAQITELLSNEEAVLMSEEAAGINREAAATGEIEAEEAGVTPDTVSGDETEKPVFSEENIEIVSTVSGNIVYDGTPKTPKYELYDKRNGGRVLIDTSEYRVEYSDNTDPGWALVRFISEGKTFEEGIILDVFFIKYDMSAVKAANTEASMSSVSGNILFNNPDPKFDVYAYVVEKNSVEAVKKGNSVLEGTVVNKDSNRNLTSAYVWMGGGARRINLEAGKDYTVYVSLEGSEYFTDEKVTFIGYEEVGTVTVKEAPHGDTGDYKNGDDIKFKANIQKNQDVKLSWAPDKKADPEFGNYAAYELYALDDNGEFTEKLWPAVGAKPGTAKTCTVKAANAKDLERGIVMLRVFDKAGTRKAEYLAAVAPFLFEVQSGRIDSEHQFTFSDLIQNESLSFELQAALKENKNEKYTKDLSCTVPSEGLENLTYPVSAKQNEAALRADHYTEPALTQDTKYFFRVKSIYNYKGLTLTSAPSNAIGMNAGPLQSLIVYITGEDPQKLIDNLTVTTEEAAYNGIHADSEGTCWKKGYVMFESPVNATDANAVKSVELLRSNDMYGIYKSVKKYAPKQVTKIDASKYIDALAKEGITGIDGSLFDNLYYVEFNNFPPEEQWYYKVRVISKKGAVGGSSDGYLNITRFEKVQDLFAIDTGLNTVSMVWKHDDCAKQYWIYRVDNTAGEKVDYEAEFRKALGNKPMYIVNGGSAKKTQISPTEVYRYHEFTDKKVENGREYHYLVRPVYNAQKDGKYSYDEIEYAMTMSDAVIPTGSGKAPKTLKAEQYNMLQPTLKWSAVVETGTNKIIGYRIQRISVSQYKGDETDETKWSTVTDVYKDDIDKDKKKAFVNRAYRDTSIKQIGGYLYRVCGLYSHDAPETGETGKTGYSPVASFDTKPLPVSNFAKAKLTGYDYRYGANVRFTIDKKDMELLSDPTINIHYMLECSDNGRDYWKLSDGYVMPYQATYSYRDNNDYIELRRGVNRRYRVTLTNGGTDEYGLPYQSQKTTSYQKPTGISFGDGDRNIVVGDTRSFEIKYDNGNVCELDCAPSTSNSGVVKIESWDDGKVEIKAVHEGYARITIKAYQYGWGGGSLTKEMEIHVIPRRP